MRPDERWPTIAPDIGPTKLATPDAMGTDRLVFCYAHGRWEAGLTVECFECHHQYDERPAGPSCPVCIHDW